jgi:hypothetical protein
MRVDECGVDLSRMAFPGPVLNFLAGCAQTAEKEARFRKNQPLRHMRNIEEALETLCFRH